MSRVIYIKGEVKVENLEIANQAIISCSRNGITIKDGSFVFDGYDFHDGRYKQKEIINIENKYKRLLDEYYLKVAEEKRLLEVKQAEERLEQELKRLEELERIEAERLAIALQKQTIREAKKQKIIESAKKQGYSLKKEVSKDNTIKLVLRRREY